MDNFSYIQSERVKNLHSSPTMAMTQRAAALRREGKNIISLSMGEPDFHVSPFSKDGIIKALMDNKTQYTSSAGIIELREAVADKLCKINGLSIAPDQVSIAAGAKQAIFNAMAATINDGDEVIIPAPLWVSYPDIVRFFGGNPVIVNCESFKITPEQLKMHITEKTKWFVLNNPSNPTGMVYQEHELRALADVLLQYPDVWILSDDIYEFIIFDGNIFKNISCVEPLLQSRTLTINGFSKAYSMTGLRLGYSAGPKSLINVINKIQSQSVTSVSSIIQWGGVSALMDHSDLLEKQCLSFQRRRDLVMERIQSINGLSCIMPSGAFYAYPNCEQLIGKKTPSGSIIHNDTDLAGYLLEEAHVAIVPGVAFYLSPYFRISYAASESILQKAFDQIQDAINRLK